MDKKWREFAEWWLLNGGHLHRLWNMRKYTAIHEAARTLPRAAWSEACDRSELAFKKEIDEAKAEIERLSSALEFYANIVNHNDQQCCGYGQQVSESEMVCCGQPVTSVFLDGGNRARQALRGEGEV